MSYIALKHLHLSAVALSLIGFLVRAAAALQGATWLRHRATRVLPHLVDTLLLGSAIGMLWMLRLNPLDSPWLLAKITGLLLYIALGRLALRPQTPWRRRWLALLGSLLTLSWILSAAITKHPAGWLSLL